MDLWHFIRKNRQTKELEIFWLWKSIGTFLTSNMKFVCSVTQPVQLFVASEQPTKLLHPWNFQARDWSRLSFTTSGDLPNPGTEPASLCLLHEQVGSLPLVPPMWSLQPFNERSRFRKCELGPTPLTRLRSPMKVLFFFF